MRTARPPAPRLAHAADDDEGDVVASTAPAQPRDAAEARSFRSYSAAAVAFMTDFARPEPTRAASWWSRVRPHLAPRVVDDFAGTDPALVPFTRVTAKAWVIPSAAPRDLLTIVMVPTDAGPYSVELETDATGIHVTNATPVRTR